MTGKEKFCYFVILHCMYFIFSLGGVCAKFAAQYPFLSLRFFVLYGISLINLGVYAVIWQIVLKRIPLIEAYSNKAVTLFWGLLWGRCFFGENITFFEFLGMLIVCIGIIIVVTDGEME